MLVRFAWIHNRIRKICLQTKLKTKKKTINLFISNIIQIEMDIKMKNDIEILIEVQKHLHD